MQGRQVFGAIVRGIGLYNLVYALELALYAAAHVVPIPISFQFSFAHDATWSMFHLVVGAALFWGAEFIVRMAYGAAPHDPISVFN
jgi:hypothetical protein